MAATLIEELTKVLTNLNSTIDGIRGIAISSTDGLEIASVINDHDIDTPLMHAISASIVGLSSQTVSKLGMSSLSKTVIYTPDGIAIGFSICDTMTLLCIINPGSNVGLAMIELENSIKNIRNVMGA
ncbi:MAG: hypothetical protein KAH86_00670 [Methanosarcinales archaeon]|nr:hypothetical protein [Methanosarcinales archaeon]